MTHKKEKKDLERKFWLGLSRFSMKLSHRDRNFVKYLIMDMKLVELYGESNTQSGTEGRAEESIQSSSININRDLFISIIQFNKRKTSHRLIAHRE